MITIDLEFDEESFGNFSEAIDQAAGDAMQLSVDYVAREAKGIAPVKTGALVASIQGGAISGSFIGGSLEGQVNALAPYAAFVNYGTRPHVIEPISRKALRFPNSRGPGFAFAKRVMHPGTKAQPFLDPEQYAEPISEIFTDAINLALDK
jgi:hypothetical protein